MRQHPVWFNNEQKALYLKLKASGVTSRATFREFVKNAFHNEVEKLRGSSLNMTQDNIKKLTFEAVQKHAEKALQN